MRRNLQILAVGVISASLLAACGSAAVGHDESDLKSMSTTTNQCPRDSAGAYVTERPIDVDEPHAHAGLAELKRLSTLTVAGTVSAVQDGVRAGDDSDFTYAVVTIKVDETLRGAADSQVKFTLQSPCAHGVHFSVPGQPVPQVGSSGLWFLVANRDAAAAPTMLISSGSEVLFDGAGRVTNHGEAASLGEAERLGTRDKVLDLVRAAPTT